jgi:preprotein translocase subunit SecE
MALNLYKPGQGYWTRLLSGIAGGVVALTAAKWLWDKITGRTGDYVQYVGMTVGLLVFAALGLLVYWLVAVKPRTADFLIATEGEMKKVNWPSRKEVIGSTWVVIVVMVVLVSVLFISDFSFAWLFQKLGILETGQ